MPNPGNADPPLRVASDAQRPSRPAPRPHVAPWSFALLVVLAAATLLGTFAVVGLRAPTATAPAATDYARELAAIDREIAARADGVFARELRYRRAMLAGDMPALQALAEDAGLDTTTDDVLLARLDLALHRWERVPERLARTPETTATQLLRAQALAQGGRSDDAASAFREIADRSNHWEALAGLAGLEAMHGRYDAADALYATAADDLDVRQMRAYAWILLQRGYLRFRRGDAATAQRWYEQAERAYSGHWLTNDYQAEALAAQEHYDAAIARYRAAIAHTPRPELQQALGDLYRFLGQPDEAAPWFDRAERAYLAATERGGTQYLHHLAQFYAESRPDGAKAVAYAQRELALRPAPASRALLAWALYRDGRFDAARDAMNAALVDPAGDGDTYRHAAMIELALGNPDAGRALLARAAAINPQSAVFHVHR